MIGSVPDENGAETPSVGAARTRLAEILRGLMGAADADAAGLRAVIPPSEVIEHTVWRRARLPVTPLRAVQERLHRQGRATLLRGVAPPPYASQAAVLVGPRSKPRGILWLGAAAPRRFSRETLSVLTPTAAALAFGIEQILAADHLRHRGRAERVAEDLHDGPLQILIDALQRVRQARSAHQSVPLAHALNNLEAAIAQLRAMIFGIRSGRPQGHGDVRLGDQLARVCAGLAVESALDWQVDEARLPRPVKVELLFILREALINASRHAQARRVVITGRHRGGGVALAVEDDGRGFQLARALREAPARRSFGLIGMRERVGRLGGSLRITAAPGKGTAVRIDIPLPAKARDAPRSAPAAHRRRRGPAGHERTRRRPVSAD